MENNANSPKKEDRGVNKVAKIPVKIVQVPSPSKPKWLKVKAPTGHKVAELKDILRQSKLNTVCEQAACPNLGDCFTRGTATFMILGNFCTRRCPFCDVAHGRPTPIDKDEPKRLAELAAKMALKYLVITSVDRDDLKDGGAGHFSDCIRQIRSVVDDIKIEILVPDFRGRMEKALNSLSSDLPNVFNHNMETVERLTRLVRSKAKYQRSLDVLKNAKKFAHEMGYDVATKSGIMLGLGEREEEVITAMDDLLEHDVTVLTLGQYLRPSAKHLPVVDYIHPDQFDHLKSIAEKKGFRHVASGPLVRSSYHASDFKPELDLQRN